MNNMSSLLLNLLGASLLLHSAYSCLQYRNLVRELDLAEATIPPFDVVVECIGGFVVLLLSQLIEVGALVPVTINKEKRRALVAPSYKTRDFDIYSNRAHVIKG